MVDIVAQFNTALIKENGKFLVSRWQIALEYIKFWFWIDIFSSVPWEYISSGSDARAAGEAHTYSCVYVCPYAYPNCSWVFTCLRICRSVAVHLADVPVNGICHTRVMIRSYHQQT